MTENTGCYTIDSPTAESPGYVTESDPEEDQEEYEDDETEDGPVDYPMDGGDDGDDDDDDSSRDDANDEDEDEEEEEHLAPAISTTVIPVDEPVFPPKGTEPFIPPPSTDITIGARITVRPHTSISLPSEAETLVDRRDDIPESEQPPYKRLYLSTLCSRYEVGESSIARPTRGQGIYYGFVSTVDAEERRQGFRDVGYGIRDTWVDLEEVVPEKAPMTMGEVNTRVTELVKLYERDTHDLYALLEDAQDSTPDTATAAEYSHSDTTLDMRREMSDMQAELLALREHQRRARQLGPEARIPDHQDASGDADSHI
ncbi:hypothetical protein Tco_0891468 [Tanacetum coccineum]|uniref:Uncharacterized protein n=1 Tax=Tanacetum coccineum TaxID=301880 RepID=A0ABQ5C2Z5_9ASTR